MAKWTITSDKFLTAEEVSRLTDYLLTKRDLGIARGNDKQSIKNYYLVRTLLETGVRVFELCALTISDFNGQKVVIKRGKGNKPRTILLTKTAMNLIKEWIVIRTKLGFSVDTTSPLFPSRYDKPYTTRGVQKQVKATFKAVNLPEHLSVHSLRHSYCSFLLASGKVGITTVQANLGHSSLQITNLYSHAVGTIDDNVELYASPSSQKSMIYEPQYVAQQENLSNSVKSFCRKANFK